MPVDHNLFASRFSSLPRWVCPTCNNGHLVHDAETFIIKETGPSKSAHAHDDWDPDWITRRFAGLLRCDNGACGELVAIAGNGSVAEDYSYDEDGQAQADYSDRYHVQSIMPAPWPVAPIFGTPERVREALAEAAGLLWSSAEAAANQVRQAVEHLMDFKGVKKQVKGVDKQTGKPKTSRIMLHARILEFKKQDAANAEILLAVKWLGNSGSHNGGIKRADVLDAFDMMELVLNNMFGHGKALMKKVRQVNKNKGPTK